MALKWGGGGGSLPWEVVPHPQGSSSEKRDPERKPNNTLNDMP